MAVTATECWRASELKASAVFFKELECTPVHHGAEDLGADVHEHDASPLIRVR